VTERVQERLADIGELVVAARRKLAELDEPAVAVGMHCGSPHECEFWSHCAPPPGKYPVFDLGGSKEKLFELMHSGYSDVRDVPEAKLDSDVQRRIWQQSRLEAPYVGAELREVVSALPFPRYYLDFETIGPAVPMFAGTRAVRSAAVSVVVPHREEPRRGRARRVPRARRRTADAPTRRAPARDARARAARSSSTRRTSGVCCTSSRRATTISPQGLRALAERIVDLHPGHAP
jgi:hypothetical protein